MMSGNPLPPSVTLQRLMAGTWVAHAISLAARLSIPDLLAEEAKDAGELARVTETHPPSLYRLLRALASVGIFQEAEDGRFGLTPLAEPLRSGVPGSLRAFAILLGEEWHWRAWGDLPHAVRTGESAFEHLYGMTNFAYWAQHSDAEMIFDQAMTNRSGEENEAVVTAYDFSGIDTLVDVGGGHGSFLASILGANPGLRGILFDRPEVVEAAKRQLDAAGLQDRCGVLAGNFFEAVPPGGDAYALKKVIHDWDDERAIAILRNCHRAMPTGGRLLLVEPVVPLGNEPSFAKLLDLLMLVWTPGGKERTEMEHRALLTAAGFEMRAITATAAPVSVIEAVRT
jgi:SAM-dependent methyltransferase